MNYGLPLSAPEPGTLVRVRSRQYLVQDVVRPRRGEEAHLIRLACVEDYAQGEPLEVLWEREACPNGHVSDIDWKGVVHAGTPCGDERLVFVERGNSGDLGDIEVRCEGSARTTPSVRATRRRIRGTTGASTARRVTGVC